MDFIIFNIPAPGDANNPLLASLGIGICFLLTALMWLRYVIKNKQEYYKDDPKDHSEFFIRIFFITLFLLMAIAMIIADLIDYL
ncbi:hypothetical protein [Dehalococcoides mccartyi]|jgi:cytochrome bd-type quinol oxidase subunit 1|uniref:hypothetical protein n=1 Tax=Dehalococcoides mccartyi TaxID=61435 RepID=UPI0026EBBDD5|nr:hypothetical protein [Dehalococcoides mccartyi]